MKVEIFNYIFVITSYLWILLRGKRRKETHIEQSCDVNEIEPNASSGMRL